MNIKNICDSYFNAFSILNNSNISTKERFLARISVVSYFFVLPPIIFGVGYIFSNISQNHNQTTKKTHSTFFALFNFMRKPAEASSEYPEVKDELKPDFFIEVLNKKGYSINGKKIRIPAAKKPRKFLRLDADLKKNIKHLKAMYNIKNTKKIRFQFKDKSTEEAINESIGFKIALNFANEHHIGGGPGFHRDESTGLFVYDSCSAKAQEESLSQRSDLMASLMQLPHTLKADFGTNFKRSYYKEKFDSTKMAYISLNSLFGVQKGSDFYQSSYLKTPQAVAFITSAANCYGSASNVDCKVGSEVYKDASQRIESHLLAAASQAGLFRRQKPKKQIELVLGAFGCGAFAPKGNPDQYRKMIANIYKKLLPKFEGFFDVVTFAVPTFGSNNPSNAAVANYRVFKQVLNKTLSK